MMLLEKTLGELAVGDGYLGIILAPEQRQFEHFRQALGYVTLGNQPQLDHEGHQRLPPAFFLQTLGAGEIRLLEPPLLNQ